MGKFHMKNLDFKLSSKNRIWQHGADIAFWAGFGTCFLVGMCQAPFLGTENQLGPENQLCSTLPLCCCFLITGH